MIHVNGNEELKKKIVIACQDHGWEPWKGKANWVGLAEVLGEDSPERLRSQYRRLRDDLEESGSSIEEYLEQVKEEDVVYAERVEEKDIKETFFNRMVEFTGIDTELFQVEKGKFWGSPTNPNVTVKFERRQIPMEEQMDRLIERMKEYKPKYVSPKSRAGAFLAIASIYDLHLERAGIDGSGLEETERAVHQALNDFGRSLARYSNELKEIVIPIGNDFSNADNPHGLTFNGTPQENSVHWRISIDKQCEIAVFLVDYMLQFAPVRVVMVPGNHDRSYNKWLGKYLEAWYRGAKNVVIDNVNRDQKYYRFGDNAFMFIHGESVKKKSIVPTFAVDGGHVFHEATTREVHTGHFHGRKETFQPITEEFGVITRVHPSLSVTSDWEGLKAFTMNNRAGMLSVYHEEKGLDGDFYVKV